MSEIIEKNNNDAETASSDYSESETDYIERKPRSRERGPDKKPRTYRANSMGNIVQFKKRPEEFVQYLKDEKGVDVTGNSSILKTFLIFGGTIVAIFGGFLLYNHYKNRKNDDIEKEY